MNEPKHDLFNQFKQKGFGLLFADAVHPEAYQEACLRSPTFFEQHNALTGDFYDDLDNAGVLTLYRYAMFDDINIGHINGFYAGNDALLKQLMTDSPSVCQAMTDFMSTPYFSHLYATLQSEDSFTAIKRQRLKEIVHTIDDELAIAESFMAWGCTRAGLWFEEHALSIKKMVLSHLEKPSIENNLPGLYLKLSLSCCFEPAIKQMLVAFYEEKKLMPDCLDTSPLFTVISNPTLSKYYPLLFKPLHVDGLNPKDSKKGQCLFDVNEYSTHPKRLDLSAMGFALQNKQVDIAYALFRSKAQFSREEFSQLIHLSISELDDYYQIETINKLSIYTFQKMNEMLENSRNKISVKHAKRFRLLFHAWLVRGSDLERQQLFVSAIERNLLTLAVFLSDKAGVNINSVSSVTGKTLLHIAVEKNAIKAVLKICSNNNCDLNHLDNEGKHVLQLSKEPLILAPVIYYLLIRSGDNLFIFLARKIKELLTSHTITYSHQQGIDLIAEVRQMVLISNEEGE